MSDYSIDFHTLASRSQWSLAALLDTSLHRLAAHIKDALVAYDIPSSLDGAIDLAILVDLRAQSCQQEILQLRHLEVSDELPVEAAPRPAAPFGEEEPLQLGRTSLT